MKEGWPVRIEVELLFCLPTGIRYLSTNLSMCCSFPLAGGLCFFTDKDDSIFIFVNKESVHYLRTMFAHQIKYGIVKFKTIIIDTICIGGPQLGCETSYHHHLVKEDQVMVGILAMVLPGDQVGSHVLAIAR